MVAKVILRVVQLLFAMIAFACSGWLLNKGYKSSDVGFMTFTGVTAFVLAAWYLVVSCSETLQRVFHGVTEVVINAVWSIFFLAASAAIVAQHRCKSVHPGKSNRVCDTYLASAAFGFMSWLLWLAGIVPAVIEMRSAANSAFHSSSPYQQSSAPVAV